MNNDLAIRSLLVDKRTGKYIKAVNEHGFDDYVQLFTKSNEKSEIVIFDFSKAVSLFHKELDAKLDARDYRDLIVKRGTVFNTWVRLNSLKNEIMLCQTALQVSRDAEEVLNWIYTRIPELEKNYRSATDSKSPGMLVNEKNSALLKISNEVEAFLEILTCHIHATLKVDASYFKTEFILGQHCLNIRKFVLDALCSELNYWRGDFRHDSMIFQCCMEDLRINPEALLFQIESSHSVEELKASVLSAAKIEDINDGYNVRRGYTVSWAKSSIDNIDRVKILSKLLQKIDSIIRLLECLKNNTVKFNDSPAEQEEFERSLESLVLEDKNITSAGTATAFALRLRLHYKAARAAGVNNLGDFSGIPLSDLDELVLRCRDEKAKSYIRESVACYKAGAFRSAIVSTWIAVSFDIIDKLKDLALTGDKEAEKQLEEFEKARQAGDIAKSLKFERDILEIARDKLELISHIEFIDLERLQQDRNRCAHPSMTSDGDIFNPSAELARVHIRSAVEYLLQYPPAQGKYALESLVKEIESEYFPTALDKAIVALKNSPLFRARESLIRNFTIILLKKILGGTSDYKEVMRVSSALKAIAHLHPEVFEGTMGKKFSSLVKSLDDNNLKNSFVALEKIKDSWEYLEPDVKQKLESFVENLPKEDLDELEFLLSHSGLKSAADRRVKYATRSDLGAPAFFILPSLVGDRIVKLYAESQSFEQANSFSSVVVRHAYDYTKGQVERIIRACGNNYEIKESFEVTTVINAMRQNKSVTDEEIDEWLIDVGLKKYTKPVAVE